ncbi:hypothetical protein A5844_001416 [Enterococcus sp. 10A9_DIV0425]|uniref:Uncharacterized protein n=1 Tax=Candidatus Enterococcus wittei TaxID=1987383 RepID=A0A242K0U6_9ENTE|nr:hypothetical protein [Enterococcus sp. 10A9_DIV0425]OTP11281.1 hypothetical protein A5844_001416 [Enterococcus sp. 10A9_DIV0425]
MIEKILLDEHSRMKLNVYGKLLILPPGEYILDNLRENLDSYLSLARLKKILFSIQEDLEKINHIQLLTNKNKLCINDQLIQYMHCLLYTSR